MIVLYFDVGGCAIYSLILLAIVLTRDRTFRTPFWIFFVSGGIYGIFCILVYDIKFSWDLPSSVVQRATSTMSAIGHTIAKFYVVLSRYAVLRNNSISDNDWKSSWIVMMLIIQFLIPLLVASPFAFAQPTGNGTTYGPSYLINIVQASSAVVYGSYVIVGSILTFISLRKLRVLMKTASEKRKRVAVRQEGMIVLYSAALFVSHSLKCIQQIIFAIFGNGTGIGAFALSLYPYLNEFAVFSSPILMLFISSKLRRLLFSYLRPSTWHQTTIAVSPFSQSTTRF